MRKNGINNGAVESHRLKKVISPAQYHHAIGVSSDVPNHVGPSAVLRESVHSKQPVSVVKVLELVTASDLDVVVTNCFQQQVDAVEIDAQHVIVSHGDQTTEGGGATSVGILLSEGLALKTMPSATVRLLVASCRRPRSKTPMAVVEPTAWLKKMSCVPEVRVRSIGPAQRRYQQEVMSALALPVSI